VTNPSFRTHSAAHPFRADCLRSEIERHLDRQGQGDRGVVARALVGLLHDIDRGVCPRCQAPMGSSRYQPSTGSRVTECRCIPICTECAAREMKEASIGVRYPVFDWYQDRAVRAEVERDLAELDAGQVPSLIDLTPLDDRGRPVG
jgi:hypothetical protein